METPPPDDGAQRRLVLAAATCAAVVLAGQLAGKAARDAIFLQQFPVTNLPVLLAVSSALAIGMTFLFARRLSRGAPVRVVQLTNIVSVGLLCLEWMLLDYFPRPVATVIFMHQTLLGPILVSGFWSVISECFDPRSARRVLGTVGTGATIGAVIGAVIAERVAAMAGTNALLLAIAGLQLVAMWRLGTVRRSCAHQEPTEAPAIGEAWRNVRRISLLRRLALITVIVTISAALLDYVFKAQATQAVTRPDDLTRLFAMFHGVVGVLTAIMQWLLGRWALQSLGLARTLATLPGVVILFGATAVMAPGIGTFAALRGAENVIRNSLYREAYEVFYTPLLPSERRSTKTVIDVGVERFGDVLGGLAVLAILAFVVPATPALLATAVLLSALGLIVALKAQQSYVEALERSLSAHAGDFEPVEPRDRTTRVTLELLAQRATGASGELPVARGRWPFRRRDRDDHERGALDPTLNRLREMLSSDAPRIRRVLADNLLSPAGVAYALPLLGQPEVAGTATEALRRVAGACVGQLADALRDPLLAVAVRAQIPSLIAEAATTHGAPDEAKARAELARAGLRAGLVDPEFEIRARAAEALAQLHEHDPAVGFDQEAVFERIRRELAVDPEVWSALDGGRPATEETTKAVGGPPSLSSATKHLATLLTLVLPAEPIRTAFHSLHGDDATLRGVALEYLENVLPADIRERMWALFAIEVAVPAQRPLEDVLAELLRDRRIRRHEEEEVVRATQIDLPAASIARRT